MKENKRIQEVNGSREARQGVSLSSVFIVKETDNS
jgi:hypothetical protein